ncbi:exopolyphosphatase [Pseudidiomarina sp. E22-M8]|uniref:Ppx/GppA phosphatase family protein n=1 Tax=Pseudidiomarina sp. E22-M8 TaxID=3424768 RepID=UPI00403D5358
MSEPSEHDLTTSYPNGAQFAALDIGSNSFHLITARVIDQHLQPLLRFKQKVRLAEGLQRNGKLNEAAIQRGLAALALCAQRLEGFDPSQVHVVATHTLREAKNRDEFLSRAAGVLPFAINIISGHEEARLIYRGVAETSSSQGKRLVIDIGGGSTEIIAGQEFEPVLISSRSMGCVSFTERFFTGGKLSEKRFKKAQTSARGELEPIADKLRKFKPAQVLGTSGTVKAITQWVQQRDQSVPDVVLREQLDACMAEVLQHKAIGLFSADGIDKDRLASLPAGLAILIGVLDELEITTITAHDAALREGVLYELAERVISDRDVRQRTIDGMAARYQVDEVQAARVAKTAIHLLGKVAKPWGLKGKAWKHKLTWAARLHEIGLQINASALQNHSGYIVAHADMPGFSKEEQALLAALVRNYRKKVRVDSIPTLHQYQYHDIQRLIALLRLAVLFNTDRQPAQLLQKAEVVGDWMVLTLTELGWNNPMLIADLEREIRQQIKLGVHLRFQAPQTNQPPLG